MEKLNETPVALDPSGDLLIVNQAMRQKTFRVSSFAMCLASPVWRAMLIPSGDFKEARPKNGEVSFPEDEPDAMFTVLSAVHYQFQHIPKTLSSTNLLNLGIVCDKYDVAKFIIPWFKSNWSKRSGFKQAGRNQILIAWLFQDIETFSKHVDHMVRDLKDKELDFELFHLRAISSKIGKELCSGLSS